MRARNGDKEEWFTTETGNHIKIEKDETPKQATKKFEIKTAIQKIKDGKETEITIKDIREDLFYIQYSACAIAAQC